MIVVPSLHDGITTLMQRAVLYCVIKKLKNSNIRYLSKAKENSRSFYSSITRAAGGECSPRRQIRMDHGRSPGRPCCRASSAIHQLLFAFVAPQRSLARHFKTYRFFVIGKRNDWGRHPALGLRPWRSAIGQPQLVADNQSHFSP